MQSLSDTSTTHHSDIEKPGRRSPLADSTNSFQKHCSITSNHTSTKKCDKRRNVLTAHVFPSSQQTNTSPSMSPSPKRVSNTRPQPSSALPTKENAFSRTFGLRVLFVFSLLVTLSLCTSLAYTTISGLEVEIGRQTYESVATSALTAAKAITETKIQGGEVMESVLSNAFPDADQWPMVGLKGYYETANTIASLTGHTSMAFIVMVEPEEVEDFEEHAWDHYRSQDYPPDAGTFELGFGIRRRGSDGNVFDRSGNYTTYNSTNQVLTPVLDHSTWDSAMLMYNVHVSSTAVDSIIECSKVQHLEQHEEELGVGHSHPNCSIVTGFKMTNDGDLVGLIYKPIYPKNDPVHLVGMIGSSVNFKDVLVSVVPAYFDGITAVISSHTQTHTSDHTTIDYDTVTYQIVDGQPRLVGEGDLHDTAYDAYGQSTILNDFNTDAPDAVIYTLAIYPDGFYQFQTKIPIYVALGFVAAICASAVVFLLYDYLMRRQSNEQMLVLDMKRRFVRFISHEIRTPLNTVCMGLELLEEELASHRPPENSNASVVDEVAAKELKVWHDITADLQDNAASAVSILNDLLNYDKIESGTLQLEVGTVYLAEVVKKAVRKFHVQAMNKPVELRLNVNQEMQELLNSAVVVGDEMRLSQVVCNLISNAIKFTPEGGTVEVSMERLSQTDAALKRLAESSLESLKTCTPLHDSAVAGSFFISVRDTGAGMTPDQISRLFSEGVQFDANKLQAGGGSGLGLCISKGIVDRHKGIVSATSEGTGKGSTFSVELPLFDLVEQEPEQPLPLPQPEQHVQNNVLPPVCPTELSSKNLTKELTAGSPKIKAPEPPEKKCHNILVVEDVASSRKMLIRLLERAGHTCEPACDGQEAVDKITETLCRQNSNDGDQDLEQGMKAPKQFDTILMGKQ